MKLSSHAALFLAEWKDAKKTGVNIDGKENDVKKFLLYIDYINNNLGEFQNVIDGVITVDEMMLPNELVGLFYPNKIVHDPSNPLNCDDLILRDKVEETSEIFKDGKLSYDYHDFVKFLNVLYGSLRKTPSFTSVLKDIRKPDAFANYIGKQMIDGHTNATHGMKDLAVNFSKNNAAYKEFNYHVPEEQYVRELIQTILRNIMNA